MGVNDVKDQNRHIYNGQQLVTIDDLVKLKSDILVEIKRILKENAPKPEKRWMKTKEVRKLLGISQGTLQTIRVNGSLPFTKIGGVYYYDFEDIQTMLLSKKFIAKHDN